MKQLPFFSIIIPTYNSEKTLKKCLTSVVNQSFIDYEVLIIDGLSTDNTLKIVENFNDSRIKNFSEADEGIYDAMNKGIKLAQGEWLYFSGSDDELYDDKVLYDIAVFIQRNNQLSFVYGNTIFTKNQNVYDGEFDRLKFYLKNICHQAIFYKKELFKIIGLFNLQYKILADWDFNTRCFFYRGLQIKYIDRIIANYDESGISSVENVLHAKERLAIKILMISVTKQQKMYFYWYHFFLSLWLDKYSHINLFYKVAGYFMRSIDIINYAKKINCLVDSKR